MRRIAVWLLCLLAMPALGAGQAAAQVIRPNGPPGAEPCLYPSKVYTAFSADTPAVLRDAIAESNATLAFRTCTDATGARTYLRAPATAHDGVCRFFEIEIAPKPGRKHGEGEMHAPYAFVWWNPPDGWEIGGPEGFERTPREFMAPDAHGCPPLYDSRYAWTEGISVGLFKAIARLVRTLSRSPRSVDALVPPAQRGDAVAAKLRQAVANGDTLQIRHVSLDEGDGAVSGYQVMLSDAASGASFALRLEVGTHGMEIRDATQRTDIAI